jgi:hypothetical protein
MDTNNLMDREAFLKRLLTLCLKSGLTDFPKGIRDQHILLKSAIMGLDPSRTFSEKEINDHLKTWLVRVCQIKVIDQVIMRRFLIDAGYLTRTKDGATYQVSASGPHNRYFDKSVEQIDIQVEIERAREEFERKKRDYLEKANK